MVMRIGSNCTWCLLALAVALAGCGPGPRLSNPNGAQFDQAGFSVAIEGNRAIVGVPKSDTLDSNAGKALIYTRSGNAWQLEATIVSSSPSLNGQLGWSVDIDGDRAIAGVFGDATVGAVTGAARIFERDGGTWSEVAAVFGDTADGDGFGISVAIDGDFAVVGAPYPAAPFFTGPGRAWVYQRDGGSGQWQLDAELGASDSIDYIEFGVSVAIDSNVVVVGAGKGIANGVTIGGAAYVFRRQSGGWVEEAKLTANDAAYHDFLGRSVSVAGNAVLAGAKGEDTQGDAAGAAYVFLRNAGTGIWSQTQKLIAGDGASGDEFGYAVGIDGPRAIVGAWLADGAVGTSGAAWHFRSSLSGWQLGQKRFMSNGEYGDGYGAAVGVSGDCAIIGVVNDDVGDQKDVGGAYIHCDLPGTVPPDFEIDIICCVSPPDPLGPVVLTSRITNQSESRVIGRRTIEWIAADGTVVMTSDDESVTVAPGEALEGRHILSVAEAARAVEARVLFADQHGVRTASTRIGNR
jgi:hypothetical protein